ncbi:MAG: thioesterase family protein [Candidatus Omnitrophota bacterium]
MKSFSTELRVKYQETDQMGVVYYANYLTWFEVARTEFLRKLGVVYKDLEKEGYFLMVAGVSCDYKNPARYDDLIAVDTWVSGHKRTSLQFEYAVSCGGKPLASGKSTHVFTNRRGKPVRIPEKVLEAVRG